MRRWLPWTLAGSALLALLLWFTLCAPERVPVKTAAVVRGAVESTVTNTKAGTVRARRRAQLSAQAPGRVVEIAHREGDYVEKNDLLIQLDKATETAQLQLARESHRAAVATHRQFCIQRDRAIRELERKRELASQNILSADVLDALESSANAARASCSSAAAEVDRARAQITVAQVALDKMEVRAPFDGVIAEVAVELGEWITPSPPLIQAPSVVDVIDPTSLYISAPMDEVDSSAIRTGQRAVVTVDSYPDREFVGHVVRVAPYVIDVEAQNRTVEIEVEIDEEGIATALLPGTSADVEVVLETRADVLRVPTAAVLEGDRVLVVEDGRLVEKTIETGLRNWDWTELVSGVAEGQGVVVTLDRGEVEPGAKVEVEAIEYLP